MLKSDNITIIPCLHGRLIFALEVRKAFFQQKPKAIAVEFPSNVKNKMIQAVQRLPQISVLHYHEQPDHIVYVPIEPSDAMIEAIRLGIEHDIPVFFIDRYEKNYQFYREIFPDPLAIQTIGLAQYYHSCIALLQPDLPLSLSDSLRENYQLFHLQRLKTQFESILYVGGMFHIPRIIEGLEQNNPIIEVISQRYEQEIDISSMSQASIHSITAEPPYLLNEYEKFRQTDQGSDTFDFQKAIENLIAQANAIHKQQAGYSVSPYHLQLLRQFARNYAFINGMLFPSVYELVISARGVDGDNFARTLWEEAVNYSHYHASPFPEITIHAEDLFLQSQKIVFHPKYQHPLSKIIPIKKRQKIDPSKKTFDPHWGFCSHQPEDLVIETFGDRLKKKAYSSLQEKHHHVEKFSTSYLDGIDIRETLRNWIFEKSIYVHYDKSQNSEISTVVVIFDDETFGNSKYPWLMTWQGEHEKESDMMVYSTALSENIVGPGISRCEYGGFLLSMPPHRMYDVWNDSFFSQISKSKAETLLYSAIAYSIGSHIIYTAENTPSESVRKFARQCGKYISFFPLKQFPCSMLQKIRVFHVLEGHHVRKYADCYIF